MLDINIVKSKKRSLVFVVLFGTVIIPGIIVFMQMLRLRSYVGMGNFELDSLADVSAEKWEVLSGKKIFFGHMSVGGNIVEGIEQVLAANEQVKLDIITTQSAGEIPYPAFAHGKLGHNREPFRKIEVFKQMMEPAKANPPDIAFMKFCYVDIRNESAPKEVFEKYKETMDQLQLDFPNTRFVHFTVPICSGPLEMKSSVKGAIKSLIGKPGVIEDNIKRDEYNEMIREAYIDSGLLFDIAKAESTNAEGGSIFAKKKGKQVPMMVKGYTTDGGHLNSAGQREVAEQLLIMLANIED